ncbi:hypothetical protein AAF712_007241 [Marasmius tenuissimus]|uniref:Zn(2)-C6 fungal-type domain-containing protein n=1 Tax=Marasmius tenuissimus TaxID=585030 RepID=A0ABR2ZWM6_9AGAR
MSTTTTNPKKRPTSTENGASEARTKARKKTTRACNGCRERKIKCDGKQPACGSCVTYGIASDCSYNPDQDHRKIAPKHYVKALEERVKFLESICAERGIALDGFAGMIGGETTDDGASTDGETDGSGTDPGVNRLKVCRYSEGLFQYSHPPLNEIDDDTGEPRQYGPQSVFVHLPEPSGPYLSTTPLNQNGGGNVESYSYIYTILQRASTPDSEGGQPNIPDFQWSKNLPYIEGMNQSLHDELLALFFTHFNDWCCWVNPALFLRDMFSCLSCEGDPPSRASHYSPMLHNAILSIAANYCEGSRLGTKDRGKPFASKAIEYIGVEGERPMLSTVSALMLLGSYHSGTAKQSLGYMYSGMGLRTCQTLGLGIDCSGSNLVSPSLKRERDRTFYMAYIQDKLWGSYVGRCASVILSDHETPLPAVEKHRDKGPWIPVHQAKEMAANGTLDPESLPPSWTSTNFLWTSKLAAISERVTKTLYSLHANLLSIQTQDAVSTLNLHLGEWYSNLPQELVISPYSPRIPPPHIIMTHAMYHFIVILLHRPFYSGTRARNQTRLHESAVSRCDAAAAQMAQLLELYRKTPGLRYAPISLTQMTFTAGTVHLLGAVNYESKRSEKRFRTALTGANECVRALQEMGRTWQCANQSGQVLENMIRSWCPQGTRDTGMTIGSSALSSPAPETPMSSSTTVERNWQELLDDPSSDLTKELIRSGWLPPTSQQVQPRVPYMPTNSALTPNAFAAELPPSMFSTLGDLTVLRGTQHPPPDHGNVGFADPRWDSNHQAPSDDNTAWANMFGVDSSFGWEYTHNWEDFQGQHTTHTHYGA